MRRKESKSKGSDLGWIEGRGGGVGGVKDKRLTTGAVLKGILTSFNFRALRARFVYWVGCTLELGVGGPDPQALGGNGSSL